MPYSEELNERIVSAISRWGVVEKKMFGGICHLLKGNMMCGVYKDYLILRLGEKQAAEALQQENIVPFDITGKPMKGWVMVSPDGCRGAALGRWLNKAKIFTEALPPK